MCELKPCPFCGRENIKVNMFSLDCLDCGGCIVSADKEQAIRAWNTRSTITIEEAVEALLVKANARSSSAAAQSIQAVSSEVEATHEGRIRELNWITDELEALSNIRGKG